MTDQNEVLAALHDIIAANRKLTTWTVSTPHLVLLWEKAQELEREECAKIADVAEPYQAADLIRARSQS